MVQLPSALRRLAFIGVLFVAALSSEAAGAETVVVRGWAHEGFGRLVFNWPRLVSYDARVTGGRLLVSFSEPAEFDLSPLKRFLSRYLGEPQAAADGTRVVFPLRTPVTFKHFRDGKAVVIDLYDTSGEREIAPASASTPAAPSRSEPFVGGHRAAIPNLKLRVGEHPGFSRLVFDWPWRIGYRVDQEPGRITVRFDQRARLDLSNFRFHRLLRVSSVAPSADEGGLTVVLATPAEAGVRHFRDGTRVVVDVLQGGVRRAALGPARDGSTTRPEIQALASTPEQPAPEETVAKQADVTPAPEPESEAHRVAAPPQSSKPVAARGTIEHGEWLPAPGPRVAAVWPLVLRFDWLSEAGRASAFRRGRHLWLAFDERAPDGLAERIAKSLPDLAPVERLPAKDDPEATVLRLNLPPALAPDLRRDGRAWVVDLRRRADEPHAALSIDVMTETDERRILMRAGGASRILTVTDPDLGDTLYVVPVAAPGLGLKGRRSFPQFRALATYQGVVIAPLSDSLRVELAETGVSIGDDAGLIVSARADRARARREEREIELGLRLFDQETWRREEQGEFAKVKQALLAAVIAAPPDRVDMAWLELARFFFAHGLATEALSVVRLISQENRRLAIDPQVLVLRAASEFLADDHERAAETLNDPVLESEWEAMLWRGALAAVSRDWAFAVDRFTAADPLIADYARPVRARLRLLAAEARLGSGDGGAAGLDLERLREDSPTPVEQAQLDYLEGRRLEMDGDTEGARSLWVRVAAGPHRPSRARARLALVELERRLGPIVADQATEE